MRNKTRGRFAFVFFFFLLLAHSSFANFTEYYEQQRDLEEIIFSDQLLSQAQKYHYEIVGGMLGHLSDSQQLNTFLYDWFVASISSFLPSYFKEFREVIAKKLNSGSSLYYRKTQEPFVKNIEAFVSYLRKKHSALNQLSPKKIVLVGHSKGGVEILLTLLSYPELILTEQIVDHAIIIQAPTMGTSWVAESPSNSYSTSIVHYLENIEELNPAKMQAIWKKTLKNLYARISTEDRQELNKRISFIGTYLKPERGETWLISVGKLFSQVKLYDEWNDGVCPTRDQFFTFFQDSQPVDQLVPEIGTAEGLIEADHSELFLGAGRFSTRTFKNDSESEKLRTRFAELILKYFLEKRSAADRVND